MKFIKSIGKGLGRLSNFGGKILKGIGKVTGELDKQSGGLLKEAVEEIPVGKQVLDAYQSAKKGVRTGKKVASVLEGKKKVSEGLREIGEEYDNRNLQNLSVGASAVENIREKNAKGFARNVGKLTKDYLMKS